MGLLKFFILPSNLIVVFIVLGLFFLLRHRKRIAALAFFIAATFYIVFSSGPVAALLLSHLEYRYPALLEEELDPEVRHIVLLAAYTADSPLMPLSGKFNSHAIFRIVEALNIYRRCQACTIWISGKDDTELMKRQLELMGVPASAIKLDKASNHTVNSAINLSNMLKDSKFYLVTSAGHMPRSMGVFKKQGLQAIAAPTDYLMPKDILEASVGLSSHHLYFSNLAVNEYAGLLWYKIRGKI